MTIQRTVSSVLIAIVLMASAAAVVEAGEWAADPMHSVMNFKVRHLFSKSGGKFDDWSATINFDPAHLEKGSVEVVIQVASINTGNEQRDGHLKSADFFDAEKFPTITFKSTKVEKSEDGGYTLIGDLTMHGVTKEVSFAFDFHGSGPGPQGGSVAGFSASLTVNRKDYGISWNKTMDAGGAILGEEVTIELEIEAGEKSA